MGVGNSSGSEVGAGHSPAWGPWQVTVTAELAQSQGLFNLFSFFFFLPLKAPRWERYAPNPTESSQEWIFWPEPQQLLEQRRARPASHRSGNPKCGQAGGGFSWGGQRAPHLSQLPPRAGVSLLPVPQAGAVQAYPVPTAL